MSTFSQRAFSSGELDPALHARVDFNRYYTGLKKLKNFIVKKQGGVENRAGTQFIDIAKDNTNPVRVIPFDAGSGAQYAIELSNLSMRFIAGGGYITLAAQNITSISSASPAVATYTGSDTLTAGDYVIISGVAGELGKYINNRQFKVGTVNTGSNTFQILNTDGTNFDSSALPAYTSGGQFAEIYTLATPYSSADLFDVQFSQSVDLMFFAHPSYPVYKLSRTSDTNWTMAQENFIPEVVRPRITGFGWTIGSVLYRYVVTAVRLSDGKESLPAPISTGYGETPTDISKSTSPVVTITASSPFRDGDYIQFNPAMDSMEEISGRTLIIKTANGAPTGTGAGITFNLSGIDTTNFSTFSFSASSAFRKCVQGVTAVTLTSSNPITLYWEYTSNDIDYFKIYRLDGDGPDQFGLVGTSRTNSFKDIGYTPDKTKNPPLEETPFYGTDNYPACVSFVQQRLFFGNKNSDREIVVGTALGDYTSFVQTGDSASPVSFKAAGRKFNPINHILDLSVMVLMTESSEIAVNPDGSPITPDNITIKTQTYNGSSKRPPIIINDNALYVQANDQTIRDLLFDYQIDGFSGNDLSLFAQHLFEGHAVVDWCYQKNPDSVVWIVRSDGALLSLTYLREQQVLAWAQHDLYNGLVESCCSIPDSDTNEDTVYFVVKRTIDGKTYKYIEKLTSRLVLENKTRETVVDGTEYFAEYDSTRDLKIMDSCLSYDGRFPTTTTVTLSDVTGWTTDDTVNVLIAGDTFTSADVGNQIHVYLTSGSVCKIELTSYTNSTNMVGRPINMDVPVEIQDIATSNAAKAVDVLSGLWHLEGESVSVLADGYVKHSARNTDYEDKTVSDGQITLDDCYAVIHVGLPIRAEMQTLNIDTVQGETLIDKKINIQKVTLFLNKTRGLMAGRDEDSDLQELRPRNTEGYNQSARLMAGAADVIIESNWESSGSVYIRQDDPLPANILSVNVSGFIPTR